MLKEDEKLLAEINERCKANPSLIGALMSISSNRWGEYLKHLEHKRKHEHRASLSNAVYVASQADRPFTDHETIMLVDAVMFLYPSGYESACCEFDREFLDKFVSNAISQFQPGDDHMEMKEMSDLLKLLYEQNPGIEFCEEKQKYVTKQTEKAS